MTNEFIAFERHRKSGKVFTDEDGCTYLQPHSHDLLKGKSFANPGEAFQLIHDHNNAVAADRRGEPFKGEVILLNVVTF